ncbi:FAD-dependent monooxygenase [Variovorax saccharolyticus]|uniref:FAD-dependent monooxygenase n=1 Tax=Variovorax saccharolyticus TaxID=3053516 RepID=UPI00257534C7|nr:FAD-dependent monooxygenase [Variovorax sp. J31P216]MDM0026071.1 FAD-dependent monooxygenase [Variovorax sp. J31P216]
MRKPVLIVGAGPVGLTLAMALRRRGVAVRIVDKAAARTDKSKALVLWARTLEMLDIEGCAAPFVDAGLPAGGVHIQEAGGKPLLDVSFSTARSVYKFALMLPQSETERLLEEELGRLQVRVERSTELLSFQDSEGGIVASIKHADGLVEAFPASWIAGCDGAHSTVRHALGAAFEGDTSPSDFLLADVEVDGEVARDALTICWAADGIAAFFPIDGSRMRVVADCGPSAPTERSAPTLEEVQAIVDQRGPAGLRLRDPVWLSSFRINERKVRDYRHGRVFLAGDAAHVHSPAGGQGMNTGMQDAFNLAWKLALVWHDRAGPALLDSYSAERSAIGDQVLRNAGNMTRVAMMRNPVLQEIRRLAAHNLGRVPALRQHMVDQLSEVDLHYRDSPLTLRHAGAASGPAPGDRAADVALLKPADGSTRLHEVLRTGKFAVLSVGVPPVELPAALRDIAAPVEGIASTDYPSGHVWLVRPDAYVATGTSGRHLSEIVAALERLVLRPGAVSGLPGA